MTTFTSKHKKHKKSDYIKQNTNICTTLNYALEFSISMNK